jgi:hypothetical protein
VALTLGQAYFDSDVARRWGRRSGQPGYQHCSHPLPDSLFLQSGRSLSLHITWPQQLIWQTCSDSLHHYR